jgi:NADH-quinone oxidoreductase subunit N
MISLGYYLPVIATMWMSPAPAPASMTPPHGAIPAIAGGSPELDDEPEDAAVSSIGLRQPELVFVAVLAGAATIVFGIVPQPLFNLVHGVGSALGLL